VQYHKFISASFSYSLYIGQPASGTASPLFSEPTIAGIAERLGITPAQVIFSWAVGHGIAVVPKSESPERQKKNIEVSVLPHD
jgi:diketogulonate reductase-like aldo/keto reductase